MIVSRKESKGDLFIQIEKVSKGTSSVIECGRRAPPIVNASIENK